MQRNKTMWNKIWGKKKHNRKAEGINSIKKESQTQRNPRGGHTHEITLSNIEKIPNWKIPGHDGIYRFWFLKIHVHLRQTGSWTELMPRRSKYIQKGPIPSNYRSITCQPVMWKIQTTYIRERIYYSLVCSRFYQKRTCIIANFAVLVDPKIKIKESEKKNKYIDLVRDVRKLLNMRVTVLPIVIGDLWTIPKELEIGGRIGTIQTKALLRSTRILRRVLEIWEDFCLSDSRGKPSAYAVVKDLQ